MHSLLLSGLQIALWSKLHWADTTQIGTQLAVIFSTFGRNCDTLSISSSKELNSQHTPDITQSSNSRGRWGKIALRLLEVTYQSVRLCDFSLHSRQFHDNFGFNKDFLSHRNWGASGCGNSQFPSLISQVRSELLSHHGAPLSWGEVWLLFYRFCKKPAVTVCRAGRGQQQHAVWAR